MNQTTAPNMAAYAEQLGKRTDFALNDVISLEGKVSDAEWQTRVDLAACYRLVARFGWDDMLSVHISARVPGEENTMLINPYGVLFEQITASSLVKVSFDGTVLSQTPFPINPAGIIIHGGMLSVRPDVNSVLHLHTVAGVAVATHKEGLIPLNQRALYFQPILAYHDYEGIALEEDEQAVLARDFGDKWVMLLRNHGTLALGRSVSQAFVFSYFLEMACKYQIATLSAGVEITRLSQDIIDRVADQITHFKFAGLLEWPALLATLDADGATFRT